MIDQVKNFLIVCNERRCNRLSDFAGKNRKLALPWLTVCGPHFRIIATFVDDLFRALHWGQHCSHLSRNRLADAIAAMDAAEQAAAAIPALSGAGPWGPEA